ncbi:MAG: Asp-tRNA(Asn)/Glu-tRNA(Gln) amidotransferase subunit GatC [Erysipelotrichaceae bacterium]
MEKIDFQKLAKQLMFELDAEELKSIEADFELLLKQLAVLEEIDTTGVSEMIHPFEDETSYLREDNINHILASEAALSNVKKLKDNLVEVVKVVR